MKAEEFLNKWEKKNNPFYPNEMKWDKRDRIGLMEEYAEHHNEELIENIRVKNDLIYWLMNELDECFENSDLNHDFISSLRTRLIKLNKIQ